MRYLRIVAIATVMLVVAAGCASLQSASRYRAASGDVDEPFWCAPESPGLALSPNDCVVLSAQLDFGVFAAHVNSVASIAVTNGYNAEIDPFEAGVGVALRRSGPTSQFDFRAPDTLLFNAQGSGARVAGLEWNVQSASAPAGFIGPNDVWTEASEGVWRLRVWMLRPFQNQPNVFAATHPCLAVPGSPALDAPCYVAANPRPLEILVTNDDGYNAPGIDAAVEALRTLPNVHLTISAPLTDMSGKGGMTTPGPLTVSNLTTLSGRAATAVHGFPADSVRYALETLHANPDLVVSGINNGQNTGSLVDISGTVGAARVAGRAEIPAVALSQGLGVGADPDEDYPTGVTAMLSWVNRFLHGEEGPARFQSVVNINIPSCPRVAGVRSPVRGTIEIATAPDLVPNPFTPMNCLSTKTTFLNDNDAYINGYVTVSSIGT